MEPRSTGTKMEAASQKPEGKDRVGRPIARDEVSGLHEIKQLAASTIDRARTRRSTEQPVQAEAEALLNQSPVASGNVILPQPGKEIGIQLPSVHEPVAHAGAPAPARSSRAGLYALLAVVVLGAGGLAFWYMQRETAPAVTVQAPPPAPPPAAPVAPELALAGSPMPEQKETETGAAAQVAPPPAEQANVQVAGNAADQASGQVARDSGATKASAAKATASPEAARVDAKAGERAIAGATKPAPAPVPAKDDIKPLAAAKGAAGDDLGALLDGQADKGSEPQVADAPALPEKLSPSDVKKGMGAVRARVQGCYDKYQQAGTAKVKARIEADGTVSSAEVVGDLAGSETAACVVNAVKNAKFPAVSGPALSINYPFVLAAE
jgi:hypothetical protein